MNRRKLTENHFAASVVLVESIQIVNLRTVLNFMVVAVGAIGLLCSVTELSCVETAPTMSDNNNSRKRPAADIPSQLDDPSDKGLYYQAVNEWQLEFEDLDHFLEWKHRCENGNSDTESELPEEDDTEEEGPEEDEQWDYGDAEPQTVLDCGYTGKGDSDPEDSSAKSFRSTFRSATPARSERGGYSRSYDPSIERSGRERPLQQRYVPPYGGAAGPSASRQEYHPRSVQEREETSRATYGYRPRSNQPFVNRPYQAPRYYPRGGTRTYY